MKILIVEDEEKLAALLKKGLQKEGYSVDTVFDGISGQYRIEYFHKDYDLVILDLMLPGISGIEICNYIRSRDISLPILMLTAKNTTDDIILGLNKGADDYLTKPFEFKELLARISSLLRRPSTFLPEELKVKDLSLNTNTKRAFRGEKEIPLTSKEFNILRYFMRNPGKVLSREMIMNNIWDDSSDLFSNIIDAHMKNLRKKIDSDKQEKLFETIRNAGYRLKI